MLKKFLLTSTLLLLQGLGVHSQTLKVEDAIAYALKKNYDILLSKTGADIDRTNNTAGNAGMLPEVNLSASDNYSLYNLSQGLSGGSTITSPDATTNSFNAGIALNWTIFNGGMMFITKKKLGEIEVLGELQFREQVCQTMFDVIVAYYNVVKQKQQLASYNEVINYNNERVKILQTSYNAGLCPKTDLLQAKIDLNVNMEQMIGHQALIIAVKRILNQLMGQDPEIPFEVEDSIPIDFHPDKNEMLQQLYLSNPTVLSRQKEVDIGRLSIKEMIAMKYPSINFSAGYNFLYTNNSIGNIDYNRTYGPMIGGELTLPLYNSGNINRQIKVARLQLQSNANLFEQSKLEVNTQLQNAITDFEYQQKLLTIEQENIVLARENLEISMHRLRLGQTTSLEVHQAQESYVTAYTRLINYMYLTKVSETRLKQLLGKF